MWRRVVLLIAVGLVAAGCGFNSDPEDAAGGAREIPAPKSSGWGTVPIESLDADAGAERVVSDDVGSDDFTSDDALSDDDELEVPEAEPVVAPEGVLVPVSEGICAVFLAVMVTSPAEFGSDSAATAAYRSALEPISVEAATLLDEVSSGGASSDRLWQLLGRLDEITLAGCSVPFANAQIILATYDVDDVVAGWPSSMPCFVATGEPLSAFTLSHAAVDCSTGQQVGWRDGEWQVEP